MHWPNFPQAFKPAGSNGKELDYAILCWAWNSGQRTQDAIRRFVVAEIDRRWFRHRTGELNIDSHIILSLFPDKTTLLGISALFQPSPNL
jgi:hypothetical protein